ncbi:MAG: class I SAM-dependent methyltransferase [Candidatus Abyssubacteria bacterium]
MHQAFAEVFFEIHSGLARESPGSNKYTRQAFNMLPKLEHPRILDIGCGPGAATLQLARLTNGDIVALDTHQPFLDRLANEVQEAGFSRRVTTVNRSMFDMGFPNESFDIIWAEGSIYNIGFERGLREWRRLLKHNGFLVASEVAWLRPNPPEDIRRFWEESYPAITTIAENLRIIRDCGFKLIGHFVLPKDAWDEYYLPLEQRIRVLREKYDGVPAALQIIAGEQLEIDLYRKYSDWYGYVFFVTQKSG